MEPFKIPNVLESLRDTYPEASLLLEVGKQGGDVSRAVLTRLWLSEGIPYAFRECPALYDIARSWIAGRLGILPKEISVTGSGRLGTSLSPSKVGRVFGRHSDLDFFVVSEELFEKVVLDFNQWSYNFESANVAPQNSREAGFWRDNNERGPKIIQRGFIDSKMVPNLPQYPTIKDIARTMWMLKEKLAISKVPVEISGASIRVYRSWPAFVQQVSLGLM